MAGKPPPAASAGQLCNSDSDCGVCGPGPLMIKLPGGQKTLEMPATPLTHARLQTMLDFPLRKLCDGLKGTKRWKQAGLDPGVASVVDKKVCRVRARGAVVVPGRAGQCWGIAEAYRAPQWHACALTSTPTPQHTHAPGSAGGHG